MIKESRSEAAWKKIISVDVVKIVVSTFGKKGQVSGACRHEKHDAPMAVG